MIVDALGPCDRRCPWCARELWKFLRGTMHRDMYKSGAAATSNHGPGPGEEHSDRVEYARAPTRLTTAQADVLLKSFTETWPEFDEYRSRFARPEG